MNNGFNKGWGLVLPPYTENITHFFCKVVQIECDSNVKRAYGSIVRQLETFSKVHSEKDRVRAISTEDNIIQYFFNGENAIPRYIYYWLNRYYGSIYGDICNYSKRHLETYVKLQKIYLHMEKQERRKWKFYKRVKNILEKIHIKI
jgi:hypothetical protein